MKSLPVLVRQTDQLFKYLEQQQGAQEDTRALALITEQLLESLSQMNADGTFPAGYKEPEETPEERAILERFSRRYHTEIETAHTELLCMLESRE